ncbi:ABC transporter ATP-binding protein [uncultured Granulicatella sp.]|uniref:ABC transporter ATP-binding protein n=1 Tax=uncultured Granulicatella sp. TaxID=316089 RepID=UPI0028DBE4CC|nr:ABC transporter ATP-binding protein [uncultured Granulicatella sp.]
MMKKLIELSDVSIRIKKRCILENFSISFSDETGVIGLVGLNGAGKTSFIKSIFGCYSITSGKILRFTDEIAYCPDVPDFPTDMTTLEVLEYSRMLSNKKRKKLEFYKNILQLVGLSKSINREISYFSRGMKQRVGIASVLALEPQIIFFDEPTSALDSKGREEIIEILRNLGKTKLVIFSSHILNDVEKIANRIIVIHKGKKIFDDNILNLLIHNDPKILVTLNRESSLSKLKERLVNKKCFCVQDNNTLQFSGLELYDFLSLLNENICSGIVSIERSQISLEQSFDNLIERNEYSNVSYRNEKMDTK